MNFVFNGIQKDYLEIKYGEARPGAAPVKLDFIKVDGYPGAYLNQVNRSARELTIPINLYFDDYGQLQKRKEEMAMWLIQRESKKLIFDDEPDRFLNAIFDGDLTFEEHDRVAFGDLKFVCYDPFKYGTETHNETIPNIAVIDYKGDSPSYPILELTAKEASTFALVENESDKHFPYGGNASGDPQPKYMLVGEPYDIADHTYREYERVFYSNGETTTGWAEASDSDIDGGTISGKIVSKGSRFIVDDYGSGSQWHGPGIKHSLEETIQDFRLSTYVNFLNKSDPKIVGRIEIYLRDVNGKAVAKMSLKDTSAARANVTAEIRAGDRDHNDFIINESGSYPGVWNNFTGRLLIERRGNVWSTWLGVRKSDGTYHKRRIVHEWIDYDEEHTRPVALIVIHMATVGDHTPPKENTGFSSIIFEEINEDDEGIPYIFEKDDVIRFDMQTGDVYINGVNENKLLAFGSDPFQLVRGVNKLVVHPDIFDSRIIYRDVYN